MSERGSPKGTVTLDLDICIASSVEDPLGILG